MKIYEVTDKKKYMGLLLLADEQEDIIFRYLDKCTMFVLDDDGIKGEISVCAAEKDVLEIKNIAVVATHRNKGYGKRLIDFICEKYKDEFSVLQVGTGDSPLTVPFYEKCGFVKSHAVENFFIDNYDHPIYECGKRLADMIYLRKKL